MPKEDQVQTSDPAVVTVRIQQRYWQPCQGSQSPCNMPVIAAVGNEEAITSQVCGQLAREPQWGCCLPAGTGVMYVGNCKECTDCSG